MLKAENNRSRRASILREYYGENIVIEGTIKATRRVNYDKKTNIESCAIEDYQVAYNEKR